MGKGVSKAVENINQNLGPALKVRANCGCPPAFLDGCPCSAAGTLI